MAVSPRLTPAINPSDGSDMTDRPRRPTLSLKNAPRLATVSAPLVRWKCKPCGAPFEVSPSVSGHETVRCPACNARLGRAEQFRTDEPLVSGVRARRG
jgi:hypothetical protein